MLLLILLQQEQKSLIYRLSGHQKKWGRSVVGSPAMLKFASQDVIHLDLQKILQKRLCEKEQLSMEQSTIWDGLLEEEYFTLLRIAQS